MWLADTFSISSSRLTELPAGRVWKPARLFWSKVCPSPFDGAICEGVVRIMASALLEPAVAPLASNFGSTRSRGLKFGVSELETFSDRTRWRSWCHCILVRRADNIGRSLMDIAAASLCPALGTTPTPVGRICRVYG